MANIITLTTVAVLECPRVPGPRQPKSVVFDAQIWLPTERPLVAGLRYFNKDNHDFDPAVNKCLIIANVVKYTNTLYPLLNSKLGDADYDLFGDIVQLIILPDGTDPRCIPLIQVAGRTDEAHDTSFGMQLSPCLSNIGTTEPLTFSVMGHFRDLARYESWKDGKPPVPQVRSNAFFCGLLTSTTSRDEGKAPDQFHVDVESVTFLARSAPPIPRIQQNGANTPGSTPKKLKFDFNTLDSPESPTKKRKTRSTVTTAEAGPSTQS